jgi:hypothetical protein
VIKLLCQPFHFSTVLSCKCFLTITNNHLPHIHVVYQDYEAVFSIQDGSIIEGEMSSKQRKMIEAWIEIHKEELLSDWKLAISVQEIFKIDPLK